MKDQKRCSIGENGAMCPDTVAALPDRTNPTRSPRAARTSNDAEYFQQTIRGAGGATLLAYNGSSRHVGDDRKSKADDGESSEADTFLADMVKKTNCNAREIPYIFQRARSLSLKIAMSEIQNEFKGLPKKQSFG